MIGVELVRRKIRVGFAGLPHKCLVWTLRPAVIFSDISPNSSPFVRLRHKGSG